MKKKRTLADIKLSVMRRLRPLIEKAVDKFIADKPERPILIPDKSGTAVVAILYLK
jgi:hypothetical protein